MRNVPAPPWILGVLLALIGLLILLAAPGCALARIRPRPANLPITPTWSTPVVVPDYLPLEDTPAVGTVIVPGYAEDIRQPGRRAPWYRRLWCLRGGKTR